MGLLLVTSYISGTFEMYSSAQGEVFFKAQSSIRVKAKELVVIWMGKFIPLQLSLCFRGFPTLEQSQRPKSSSSHPSEH